MLSCVFKIIATWLYSPSFNEPSVVVNPSADILKVGAAGLYKKCRWVCSRLRPVGEWVCGCECDAATPLQVTTVHTRAPKVQYGSPHKKVILTSFWEELEPRCPSNCSTSVIITAAILLQMKTWANKGRRYAPTFIVTSAVETSLPMGLEVTCDVGGT